MGQSNNIDENKNTFRELHLDVDYYQTMLDDPQLSEDQKRELIETLWNIVIQFIDLGFGIHPFQQAKAEHADDTTEITLSELIGEFADQEREKESEPEGVAE